MSVNSVTCPVIDEAKFNQALNSINQITNGEFQQMLSECNSQNGGMRGGLNRRQIKMGVYAILTLLFAMNLFSSVETVKPGLRMIATGECGYLQNRLWYRNPLCVYWEHIVNNISRAIYGDPAAISMLVGVATGLLGAPATVDAGVERVAGLIESGLGSQPQITNSGGKKYKKKNSRRRRTRKSRKSRKSRRSRK